MNCGILTKNLFITEEKYNMFMFQIQERHTQSIAVRENRFLLISKNLIIQKSRLKNSFCVSLYIFLMQLRKFGWFHVNEWLLLKSITTFVYPLFLENKSSYLIKDISRSKYYYTTQKPKQLTYKILSTYFGRV